MHKELENKLFSLAERAENLLAGMERQYPPPASPDWSATALRWQPPGRLVAVPQPHRICLNELRAIDRQKRTLLGNTEQFLHGLPANNALLWGARGTGKSSLIKAVFNRFSGQGLRLIEVDAQHLVDLPDIVAPLYERPERFIIFADDLSFEAGDPGYKALKAALDGSIVVPPENVLIYATSNRRHLLPEFKHDNSEAQNVNGEIHHGEAVEEKISLSERFGLWLSFYPFDQQAYLNMVHGHLEKLGVSLPNNAKVEREALQWALSRGSRSGRVAWQFARDWAGRTALSQ